MPSFVDYFPATDSNFGELPGEMNPPNSGGGVQNYATVSLESYQDFGPNWVDRYAVTLTVRLAVATVPSNMGPETVSGQIGFGGIVDLSTYSVVMATENQGSIGVITYTLFKQGVPQSEFDALSNQTNDFYQITCQYKGETFTDVPTSMLGARGNIAPIRDAVLVVKQNDPSGAGQYTVTLNVTDFPFNVAPGNAAFQEVNVFINNGLLLFSGPIPGVVVVGDNLGTIIIDNDGPSLKSSRTLRFNFETNTAGLGVAAGFGAVISGSAVKVYGSAKLASGQTWEFVGPAYNPTT